MYAPNSPLNNIATHIFMGDASSMPDKALKACRAAIQIHDSVLEKVKPGITTGELFLHAESLAGSLGYAEFFLGPPGSKVSF